MVRNEDFQDALNFPSRPLRAPLILGTDNSLLAVCNLYCCSAQRVCACWELVALGDAHLEFLGGQIQLLLL